MSIFKEILVSLEQEEVVIFNFAEILSFKKRAIDYFSDCPIVVSKIENSKYQRKGIKELIEFYNESCAK